MRNRSSNFTTIGGLIFLAVLLFYTNAMGYRRIAGFLIFFLLLALCSYLWGKAALRNIDLEIPQTALHAFPGETLPVQLILSNSKLLPVLWMDLLFPLPLNRCVGGPDPDVEDYYEDPDLPWKVPVLSRKISFLMPFQKISWSVDLKARQRGIWHLGAVYLESGDGFGLSVVGRRFSLPYPRQITIYPKKIPVDVSSLLRQNPARAQGNYGYQEDLSLLKNSRAYQSGDNARHINWRLLARQQELMVNEYETVTPQCIGFYIDLESFMEMKEESGPSGSYEIPSLQRKPLEDMLSLVGSCILELTEKRVFCGLLIPGYGDQDTRFLCGTDLEYQAPQLLEALSAISYDEQTCETKVSRSELRRMASAVGQIIVTGHMASRLRQEVLTETVSPHLLSYLFYEQSPEDRRIERPVCTFQDLAFLAKEDMPS